jgi:hypothetical protein
MPTPIVETSTGKKASERSRPRPMIRDVSSTARPSPRTTLAALVTAPKTRVLVRPRSSAGSAKNVAKFSRPMNCQSVSRQRVRLKKNDANVGSTNSIT